MTEKMSPAPAPAAWRRSSHSTNEGGACVEVAATPAAVLVRDSKTPGTAHLALTTGAWGAFLESSACGR